MKKLLLLIPLFIMIIGVKGYAESYTLVFSETSFSVEVGGNVIEKIPKATVKTSSGENTPYTYISYKYEYMGISVNNVDVNHVGTYNFYVVAESSAYGLTKIASMTVNVIDTKAPIVSADDIIERGYYETSDLLDYVTVTDNVDTPYQIEVECDYDPKVLDDYLITFRAIDASGNIGEKTSILKIVDNLAPVIDAPDEIILNYGEKFNLDEYVSVLDEYDLTNSYNNSEYNLDTIGYQKIDIIAIDEKGNEAIKSIDLVIYDLEKPTINLKGKELTIAQNEDFSSCIESVSDNYDSLEIKDVKISSTKVGNGVYKVFYTLTDCFENETTIYNFVTIEYDNKPVIKAKNLDNITDPFDPYDYVEAYDMEDGDITDKIYLIEANYDDKYCIYEVYDSNGNIVRQKIDLASKMEIDSYNGNNEQVKVTFPKEENIDENTTLDEPIKNEGNNAKEIIIYGCIGLSIILIITLITILIRHFKKKML